MEYMRGKKVSSCNRDFQIKLGYDGIIKITEIEKEWVYGELYTVWWHIDFDKEHFDEIIKIFEERIAVKDDKRHRIKIKALVNKNGSVIRFDEYPAWNHLINMTQYWNGEEGDRINLDIKAAQIFVYYLKNNRHRILTIEDFS